MTLTELADTVNDRKPQTVHLVLHDGEGRTAELLCDLLRVGHNHEWYVLSGKLTVQPSS